MPDLAVPLPNGAYEVVSKILKNRDDWATLLKSGIYEQGQMKLKRTVGGKTTYCCLGVACDVYGPQLGVLSKVNSSLIGGTNVAFSDGSTIPGEMSVTWSEGRMPGTVLRFFGLSEASQSLLIQLNDNGVSFKNIADILRYLPISFGLATD